MFIGDSHMYKERPMSLLGDVTNIEDLERSLHNHNITAANIENFGIQLPPILPKTIKEKEYYNCTSLVTIAVGDDICGIGSKAFSNCINLCAVVLPPCLRRIKSSVFSGCHNLQKIIYRGTKSQWFRIQKDCLWNIDTGNYTVICTDGTLPKS